METSGHSNAGARPTNTAQSNRADRSPHGPRRRPSGSFRRSLSWRISGIIGAALGIFFIVTQQLAIEPLADRQADAAAGSASALVRAHLDLLFQQVSRDLELARMRGKLRRFSVEDADGFNAWFLPYLTHIEKVTSVILARDDGREILLLQQRDGSWMNRLTDPVGLPGRVRRITRSASGHVVEDVEEASDYDARARPWYTGATELASDDDLHWTDPYTFFTTGEPGITASVRWRSADGSQYVLAFDVLLRDLAKAIRHLHVSDKGAAALLTLDGRVLAPPGTPSLDEGSVEASLLAPIEALHEAPFSAAVRAAHRARARAAGTVSFRVGGQRWHARVEPYALGASTLRIVTMAPASDFAPSQRRLLLALLATAMVVLLAGAAIAERLAARFAEPLGRLAEQSERIGSLDFSGQANVETPWMELQRLAEAHDRMRGLLQESTQGLETANRQLEARVEERTAELRATNAELASFGYAVSHDLRSPLRAINGFCTELEASIGDGFGEEARWMLGRVRAASTRMDELIDGLLAVARLSARPLAIARTDLSQLAEEVAAELRASDRGRVAQFHIAPDAVVHGDPALLRDVMANLLGNAWKYTVACEAADIRFEVHDIDGEQRFCVRDNGIGFDMAHAGKLFAPFQRLHAGSGQYPGTGIGLATVHRILELHGGHIRVESAVGRGTTFWFTLGTTAQDLDNAQDEAGAAGDAPDGPLRPPGAAAVPSGRC